MGIGNLVRHFAPARTRFFSSSFLGFTVSAIIFAGGEVYAACGSNTYTWDAGNSTTAWNTANNWNPNTSPNGTSDNVIIVAATREPRFETKTVSCFDVQSGRIRSRNNRTVTVVGDYFRNLYTGGVVVSNNHNNFLIDMAGSGAQTFENVDEIPNLRISNDSSVTLTEDFDIERTLVFNGTSPTLYVDANVTLLSGASDVTIPSGATLEIKSGGTLTLNASLTVNGALVIQDGASLVFGNGETLSVSSTGTLTVNGAYGNAATISSSGSGTSFSMSVAGIINAQYFRIDRLDANGLNVTGTIQKLDDGEFHYIANAGHAVTIGASATVPATFDTLGFYDDDGHGNTKNINATAYTGSVFNINNWSGSIGGASNETDPFAKIVWGTQAGTTLNLSENTAVGNPPAVVNQASGDVLFVTYAFSLNQASTSTDITSLTISMVGTASAGDIDVVKVFRDGGGGSACIFDAGQDVQLGTDLTLSGLPASATLSITPGDVSTSSDSDVACIHILAATTSNAQGDKTIKFEITGTADVTNSQGYSFSGSSGPPVSGGVATINGDNISRWQGDNDDRFTRGNNWQGPRPNLSRDCAIGVGVQQARINDPSEACQNAVLQTGGQLDFDGSAELQISAALTVETGFNFVDTGSGAQIVMVGTGNQSFSFGTAFPANLVINNTGTAPSNIVSMFGDSEIQGDLTITSGVMRIPAGYTLTVLGNISVQTGASIQIEQSGILELGDGSVLTVDSGGTLQMVGAPGQVAKVTSNVGSAGYSVVINGTVLAQHYNFDHLGINGVSVEAGATINTSYFFQDGSFTYPVDNNTSLLNLKRHIPGNTLSGISFESSGSGATGVKNINTTGASVGTLNVTSYSGDLAGDAYETAPSYTIDWAGATNTITIEKQADNPASMDAGNTYNMGRWAFTQTLPGAYSDADVTSFKVTMNGTASAGDVDQVRLYFDSDCNSSAGTLLGSGAFTGNPATATFPIGAGNFTVASDGSTPPTVCVYAEFDLANGASDSKTIGMKIEASTDIVNDQGYAIAGFVSFPLTAGAPGIIVGATNTTWTGTTSTDWFDPNNWSAGVPSSNVNCTIDNVTNDPVISGGSGTAYCKNITIGSGEVTFSNGTGAVLEIHGSYTNTGTVTQYDGIIRITDAGAGLEQSVTSSSAITNLQILKTGGGTVTQQTGVLQINQLIFQATNTGRYLVPNGKIMILPNGVSIPNGTLEVSGGGVIQMNNGTTLTVNGGTFKTSGTSDTWPQNEAQKGKVGVNVSGSWGFNATSGSVDLTGFLFDYLDSSGMRIGPGVNFVNFESGLFKNLSESYSGLVVMEINTSNLPSSYNSIEWYWGPNNTPPSSGDSYTIAKSTGCGSNIISFSEWWGDWYDSDTSTPTPDTKIDETNCDIVISWSNSPVSLTSFEGIGYENEVLLEWATGGEWDHVGFNVYRSDSQTDGFVQINDELVRNNFQSLGPGGSYHFVDTNVNNGKVYYYFIEDIATGGQRNRSSTIAVMPLSGAGSSPAPGVNDNSSSTDDGSDVGNDVIAGPVTNPYLRDLGNGVHLVAQTFGWMKLEIVPPEAQYGVSSWNGSYSTINVPGYSRTLTPGAPEIPERTLLIRVDDSFTGATSIYDFAVDEAAQSRKVQPAPHWSLDASQNLVPNFSEDATVYSLSGMEPQEYFHVDPVLQSINGEKFVKVQIFPVKYDAIAEKTQALDKLVLEISLDGSDWNNSVPSNDFFQSPSAAVGSIRMRVPKTGMYEVSYDDLAESRVVAPLVGVSVSDIRLYQMSSEIPIEIEDADGVFNSGDVIRYWVDKVRRDETEYEEVVLTKFEFYTSGTTVKRFNPINGDPTGLPATYQAGTDQVVFAEENLMFINDRPLGDLEDHFFWARIAKWNGGGPAWFPETHSMNIDLPGLISSGARDVLITVKLRGRTQYTYAASHHVGIYVNSAPSMVDNVTFSDYGPTNVTLRVPSSYFVAGNNTLTLEALSDGVPPGDLAILDINSLMIQYTSDYSSNQNLSEVYKLNFDQVYDITGFTSSNVKVYDLSDMEDPRVFTHVGLNSPDAGATYTASFAISSAEEDFGYRVIAIEDSAVDSPAQVFLSYGYPRSLKDTTRQSDLIVIGHPEMVDAAENLVAHREAEGLEVSVIDLDQIYSEFSYGLPSRQGIKDFLEFTYRNWDTPKPRYVLFLGDTSNDLNDYLGNGHGGFVVPTAMVSGAFADYASDDWFVTFDHERVPNMAIGRLPARDGIEMNKIVQKIIDYENGERSPKGIAAKTFAFYSDESTFFEGFEGKSQEMAATIESTKATATTFHDQRTDFGSDTDMKAAMKNRFEVDTPLFLTFTGHGSETQWGWNVIFEESDASALVNQTLPIVFGLNCRTGYFADNDLNTLSLGESMVLNPNGGAVAYWGSTAFTVPESQVSLNKAFFRDLAGETSRSYSKLRMGDIVLRAKATMGDQVSANDTLKSWVLLGDPSLKIPADSFEPEKENTSPSGDSGGGGGCGSLLPSGGGTNGPGSGPIALILLMLPLALLLELKRRAVSRV